MIDRNESRFKAENVWKFLLYCLAFASVFFCAQSTYNSELDGTPLFDFAVPKWFKSRKLGRECGQGKGSEWGICVKFVERIFHKQLGKQFCQDGKDKNYCKLDTKMIGGWAGWSLVSAFPNMDLPNCHPFIKSVLLKFDYYVACRLDPQSKSEIYIVLKKSDYVTYKDRWARVNLEEKNKWPVNLKAFTTEITMQLGSSENDADVPVTVNLESLIYLFSATFLSQYSDCKSINATCTCAIDRYYDAEPQSFVELKFTIDTSYPTVCFKKELYDKKIIQNQVKNVCFAAEKGKVDFFGNLFKDHQAAQKPCANLFHERYLSIASELCLKYLDIRDKKFMEGFEPGPKVHRSSASQWWDAFENECTQRLENNCLRIT